MNCIKLKEDIKKLREELASLETRLGKVNETGKDDGGLRKIMSSGLSDLLLEKYRNDFIRENPELFQLKLGDRTEIEDTYGYPAFICSITQLDNEQVLIGGGYGTFYSATIDDQDKLKLGERIDIQNVDGSPAYVLSITQLDNGQILVGGGRGTFYFATIDAQGNLSLGERIDIQNVDGSPAHVLSITQLDNGQVLIGCNSGIQLCSLGIDLESLKQNLPQIAQKKA